MAKAMVEALTMRIDTLEKSDKAAAMRIEALEKDIASHFNVGDVKGVVLAKDVKVKKEVKPKKEKKAKPGPDDKPKEKRVTGYILFSNDVRDDVKTQLSGADDKPKNTDVMTEIARQWKALDTKDRDDWNAKAAKAKALYNNTNTLHHHDDHDDHDDDDDDDN
jgi:hypothetical protein